MTKLTSTLLTLLFITLFSVKTIPAVADDDVEKVSTEETDISFDTEINVSTMNVDMLSGEKVSNRITIQPLVTMNYGDAYMSVQLTTVNLDKRLTKNSENSFDVYVGMEKEVYEGITIDAGIGFSDMQATVGDLWYVYLTAEMAAVTSPYITLEIDISTDEDALEGGVLYRVGGKYSWNDILFDLSVAGHDGAYGYKPQTLSSGLLSVSREFTLWGQKITPSLNVQKTFDNDGIAEDLVWLGLQVKF